MSRDITGRLQRYPTDERARAERDLPLPDQRAVLVRAARGTRKSKVVALSDEDLPGVRLTQADSLLDHGLEDRLELEV
jgi:hypothetical protein